MTASLEERIARVLVTSTHPELSAAKVDELVQYGVGRATAHLVIVECAAWEREQYPLRTITADVVVIGEWRCSWCLGTIWVPFQFAADRPIIKRCASCGHDSVDVVPA